MHPSHGAASSALAFATRVSLLSGWDSPQKPRNTKNHKLKMKPKTPRLTTALLVIACTALLPDVVLGADGTPRTYVAPYTYTPPVIDGTNSPGEWDAAPVAGSWHMLRQPETDTDNQNTRFRMQWDDKHLYILVQSDYANWSAAKSNTTAFVPGKQDQGLDWGADNLNFYIDPNTDGEDNLRLDGAVDGYQIAWNQLKGVGSLLAAAGGGREFKNTGLFLEDHINSPWGNQARWQGLRLSSFVQVHESTGGTVEFALAWADLDGPDRGQFATDPKSFPAEDGTAHPKRPYEGDKWIFNIARITTDSANFLPIWSWQSAQSFAMAPHGYIEFAGGPRRYDVQFTTAAPTIDGVIAPNEWDAVPFSTNWHMLRQAVTVADAEKTAFKALWDQTNLYLLVVSSKKAWSPANGVVASPMVPGQQSQGLDWNADNINLYIDPNADGEAAARPDNQVDGYQIAWNQLEGVGSLGDDGAGGRVFNNTGLFLEDHIDTPWGNNGKWQGLRQSTMVQNHGASGGVIELALAWADIDAPSTNEFPEGLPADVGTAHPRHPNAGDEWIFNIGRISSDANNFLPIWSWQPGQSFAFAPHGFLRFAGGPRSYKAQFISVAPVIDGIIDPGEWNLAHTGGGAWHVLRQPVTATDSENTRFKVMWDQTNVYFLVQSDKASWNAAKGNTTPFVPGTQSQEMDWNADSLNFYLDPNTDGEDNFRPDNQVDGYQIAWNQFEGDGSFLDNGAGGRVFVNTGLFLENHIDTPWGNNGKWQGLRRSSFVQKHDATGGIVEFALAWADVDAPSTNDFPEGLPADSGTAHPRPASNGGSWIFDISRISTDANNFLPIWSWQSAQSFAIAPHGLLTFVGRPEGVRITSAVRAAGSFTLSFNSLSGQLYDIGYSTDLQNWSVVATDIAGTGADVVYTDNDATRMARPAGYYRITIK